MSIKNDNILQCSKLNSMHLTFEQLYEVNIFLLNRFNDINIFVLLPIFEKEIVKIVPTSMFY